MEEFSEEFRKYVENTKERFFKRMNIKCARAVDYSNQVRRKKEIFYEKRHRNQNLREKIEEMRSIINEKTRNLQKIKKKIVNYDVQQKILSYLLGINISLIMAI